MYCKLCGKDLDQDLAFCKDCEEKFWNSDPATPDDLWDPEDITPYTAIPKELV